MQEQLIQGYVPAIRNGDKRRYVRFGGGFTTDYLKAVIVPEFAEALDIARQKGSTIYDVPLAVAVDENCELVD